MSQYVINDLADGPQLAPSSDATGQIWEKRTVDPHRCAQKMMNVIQVSDGTPLAVFWRDGVEMIASGGYVRA